MSGSGQGLTLVGVILVGGAATLFSYLRWGALAAGFVGLAVLAVAVARVWSERRRRAARALAAPLRDALVAHVDFYRRLGPSEKTRFEAEVAEFLEVQHITGPRDAPVSDVVLALVAASAVVLTFGRRGYRWSRLRDVVVYAEAFDEEYAVGAEKNVLGMVHHAGPILFSERALLGGFKNARDGHNVGFHEMAHVLDFEGGHADGVPSLLPWRAVEPWLAQMKVEIDRVEAHRSVLRDYAATNEAELFAVATEAYFERPEALKKKHPKLYAVLEEVYGTRAGS